MKGLLDRADWAPGLLLIELAIHLEVGWRCGRTGRLLRANRREGEWAQTPTILFGSFRCEKWVVPHRDEAREPNDNTMDKHTHKGVA